MKKFVSAFLLIASAYVASLFAIPRTSANVPCSLPFNLQNGTTADATQVMSNYNAIITCLTQAASAGVNSDITALTGLVPPLSSLFTPTATVGVTYFVGPAGTDALNDCTNSGTPCATIQHAYTVARVINWNGTAGPSIQLLDTGSTTNYDQSFAISGPLMGATTMQILGNASDNSRVVLRCATNGQTIATANDYGGITFHYLTFSGGANTSCTGLSVRNAITDLDNIVFGAFSAGTQMAISNGADVNITCSSCPPVLTFSGSAVVAIQMAGNSHITWGSNAEIHVPNAIAYTLFLSMDTNASMSQGPVTTSGAGLGATTGTQCSLLRGSQVGFTMPAWPGTANTCFPRPGSQQMISGGSGSTVISAAATNYIGMWGTDTTVSHNFIPMAVGGTFKNLFVLGDAGPGGSDTIVVALYNATGSAATTLTCTMTGAASTCTDITHSVTLAANTTYSMRAVSSGGGTPRLFWTMEFDIP